jgi:hypothetical protein
MNTPVRRKLEMAARVRTFSRNHPSDEPTYATVVGRLEERLGQAEAIAAKQHEARLAARGARVRREELRRVVHFQLLPYLIAVGNVAARDQTELAAQFQLPRSNANNQTFLAAVKVLLAAAEERRDVLVTAGMAPRLLEELQQMFAAFEAASEEARAKRLAHVGARADLQEIAGDLMEEVRVLDGLNRWRFGKDPEVLAEWQSARHLPTSSTPGQTIKTKGETTLDEAKVAPAA